MSELTTQQSESKPLGSTASTTKAGRAGGRASSGFGLPHPKTLVALQREADSSARQLRQATAEAIAVEYLEQFDRDRADARLVKSPYRSYVDSYQADDPPLVLDFNLEVTARAVDNLLNSSLDALTLVATTSRLVELGGHALHNPLAPRERPHVFLAPAKDNGYFFTPPDIAVLIAQAAIADRTEIRTLLDPAAGAGMLLGTAMVAASRHKVRVARILALEVDQFTAGIARQTLEHLNEELELDCALEVKTVDALTFLPEQLEGSRVSRADCIVMNPPYGRAKFLQSRLTNLETQVSPAAARELAADRRAAAGKDAARLRELSASLGLDSGEQDYQRLFIALAARTMSPDGRAAFISSDSWLGDNASQRLRKQLFSQRAIRQVTLYPETAGLFATVNQPTAITVLDAQPGHAISVGLAGGRSRHRVTTYSVPYSKIEALDPDRHRLPRVSRALHDVYGKLAAQPRLKDTSFVRNLRGELDLTAGRAALTKEKTAIRLVRGDHVERFVLSAPEASEKSGYVIADQLESAISERKLVHVQRPRLACRQVSYQGKARRLSFTLVPAGVVIANSCNYIALEGEGDVNVDDRQLNALLCVLNSSVLEFFFRLFNSNNHVANYEIDELPIAFGNDDQCDALARAGRLLQTAYQGRPDLAKDPGTLEDLADALVAWVYGLSGSDATLLMETLDSTRASRVGGMVDALERDGLSKAFILGDGWYQHEIGKLSDLDREIISHVPQGGNWQDIPESVPSKRLEQIRAMTAERGVVRTTYYGRLRPDQPSYTVATYFNRPGNGTNIHPWEDRTITAREAARLQSFPDSYIFRGSEASIRKQIGNAVPPLLGFAIGSHFREQGLVGDWVDLFAGAGGLSLGLEEAGCRVASAVDNDRFACETYRLNRACESEPSLRSDRTLFLEADLSDPNALADVIQSFAKKSAGARPAAVVGGPPCQGFSHAGWRSESDSRNELASTFMTVVEALRPKLAVIENVEGLLTFDKGRVVRDLLAAFRDLGYSTMAMPWTLRAETYGVPQMRRRVFLVATTESLSLEPPTPVATPCLGRREVPGELVLGAELPYPFTVAEAFWGLPALSARTQVGLGGRPVREHYGQWASGSITTLDLFERLAGDHPTF